MEILYEYYHEDIKTTSDLFRLEQLYDGFGPGAVGFLPSMKEYVGTLDPSLSYYSHKANDTHTLTSKFIWFRPDGSYIRLEVPLLIDNQHLDYQRGTPALPGRNSVPAR